MQDLVTTKSDLSNFSITSLEVANMIDKRHTDLMRDIRRYSRQLNESKIALVDFWEESLYADNKGEKRPCYNITKMGCEFIAHKTTGVKGTLFTAQYIKRFHEMEQELLNNAKSNFLESGRSWYAYNRNRINACCRKMKIQNKTFCHMLLEKIKETHDPKRLRQEIYKREGKYPQYYLGIIDFYDELVPIADEYLSDMEKLLCIKK